MLPSNVLIVCWLPFSYRIYTFFPNFPPFSLSRSLCLSVDSKRITFGCGPFLKSTSSIFDEDSDSTQFRSIQLHLRCAKKKKETQRKIEI